MPGSYLDLVDHQRYRHLQIISEIYSRHHGHIDLANSQHASRRHITWIIETSSINNVSSCLQHSALSILQHLSRSASVAGTLQPAKECRVCPPQIIAATPVGAVTAKFKCSSLWRVLTIRLSRKLLPVPPIPEKNTLCRCLQRSSMRCCAGSSAELSSGLALITS